MGKRRRTSKTKSPLSVHNKARALRVIDLFSGAGGLSLGAARAGFEVSAAVENDAKALSAHKLNFPKTVHIDRDAAELSGKELKAFVGEELAGVIGGPPCQGFSAIGKNDSKDPRNLLFDHFFRLVAETEPLFFLAENVPGILHDRNEELRRRALKRVRKQYRLLPPLTFCAKDYGAPTTRTRVFFIGYRTDTTIQLCPADFEPPNDVEPVCVAGALKGLPVKVGSDGGSKDNGWGVVTGYEETYYASRLHDYIPLNVGDPKALERLKSERKVSGCVGTNHSKTVLARFADLSQGKRDTVSKSQRLDPNGFCPTIRAGTGSDRGSFQAVRPIHPTEDRVITPREAARLQGFPDWFQFSPEKWHSFRQIGSSVSPILAERILAVIKTEIMRLTVLEE